MSAATFHVVVVIVKVWITVDLILLLALVLTSFYREWTEHQEMAEFFEEYYRR
jgi:hypothetical protein